MRPFATVISILGFVATLAAAPAGAQQPDTGGPAPHLHVNDFFDQHPGLTKGEFEEFAARLGSVLRFRPLGDATTLGRGNVDISVQFANMPNDGSKDARNNTMSRPTADQYVGRSISFPQIVVRFGVSDRVDLGAWGGFDPDSNYGLAGFDTKIVLLRQGPATGVRVDQAEHHVIGRSVRGLGWQRECRSDRQSSLWTRVTIRRRRGKLVAGGRTVEESQHRPSQRRGLARLCGAFLPPAGARPVGGGGEGEPGELCVSHRHPVLSDVHRDRGAVSAAPARDRRLEPSATAPGRFLRRSGA